MKKKFTLKRKVFLIVLLAIVINGIVLTTCYEFFVIPSLENTSNLIDDVVMEELEGVDSVDIENKLLDISQKYKVNTKLIDGDNNIIFNNIEVTGNTRYLLSKSIIINDKLYYLTVTKNNKYSVGSIRNFVWFQILLFLLIGFVSTIFTNYIFLTPLEETVKDMNNYKLGRKPKKRKIVTQIDVIQNEFVDLVEDLEEEKKNQNNIIASISHDIKTPLTSIIGYTHLLKDNDISIEDKDKYVDKIYNKSLLMKEIINDFDDYLSTNSNRTFKFKSISFNDFIRYLDNDYRDDLLEKGINFEIENNVRDISIKMDISKIKRVFSNIISNSVRYLGEDGKIKIICSEMEEYIEFEIMDNGGGVPKDNLSRIFEPLYTTDPSRKISGLGLSICREIVEAHLGKIRALNNDIGGLSIIFTINKNIKE